MRLSYLGVKDSITEGKSQNNQEHKFYSNGFPFFQSATFNIWDVSRYRYWLSLILTLF